MASPGGKYFIQDKLAQPAAHHASFEALWETKWKPLVSEKPRLTVLKSHTLILSISPFPYEILTGYPQCDKGIYPFMYGTTQDFEPVAREIIAAGLKPPYNWDEYASYFFVQAHDLVTEAMNSQDENKASELYMYVRPSLPVSFGGS